MFRNYLAAALRNLVRNRLYTAINILGLTLGFAAALLIALFVHDEFTYDAWIPGHEDTYLLATTLQNPDKSVRLVPQSNPDFAPQLMLDFPAIQGITRLAYAGQNETLRRGDVESREDVFLADPNFFALLPMPAIAGDLATALEAPDAIVLTRAMARKYFGRDDPIGETVELSRKHPMQVTAVIADLPSQSHLKLGAVASGRAPFSRLAVNADKVTGPGLYLGANAFTYVRLQSRVAASRLQASSQEFITRHRAPRDPNYVSLELIPLTGVHLGFAATASANGLSPLGSKSTIYTFAFIGVLIIAIAGVNFINLMTARAARRAVEIGVRKVSGAERRQLVVQFVGEAFVHVLLAVALAVPLVRLALPALNAFFERAIPTSSLMQPAFAAGLLVLAAATAILAGFYPAVVLSAFRPATALRTARDDNRGTAHLRQALVALQFAVLIGMVSVALISARQMHFATRENLRLDTDQVVIISPYGPPPRFDGRVPAPCASAFRESVSALSGVRASTCSSISVTDLYGVVASFRMKDGTPFLLTMGAVDFDFFDFYGLKPIAGRVFQRDRGDADMSLSPDAAVAPAVINETAVRKYGFKSAREAIGQVVEAGIGDFMGTKATQIEIIGVVPDIDSDVHRAVNPAAYYMAPKRFDTLSVRLAGRDIPETLDAIDRLWRQYGDPIPTPRRFLSDEIEARARDITRQAQLLAVFAGIAAFIAALGMFGLSTFIAERRTKEIGVRKSLGAGRGDILGLLVWQFIRPVLLANVIAWPVAYLAMRRWLQGFAYHIDMAPWMFAGASAIALGIALVTVVGHALLVARAEPVAALRYE